MAFFCEKQSGDVCEMALESGLRQEGRGHMQAE